MVITGGGGGGFGAFRGVREVLNRDRAGESSGVESLAVVWLDMDRRFVLLLERGELGGFWGSGLFTGRICNPNPCSKVQGVPGVWVVGSKRGFGVKGGKCIEGCDEGGGVAVDRNKVVALPGYLWARRPGEVAFSRE